MNYEVLVKDLLLQCGTTHESIGNSFLNCLLNIRIFLKKEGRTI